MQSITLQKIDFSYPSADTLFADLSVVFSSESKVALIGDNGTGKTTLLRILSGKIEPDAGRIVRGASVYLLPQINALDAKSGGERQQAELAKAFASGADILCLDEPTNNLDTAARAKFLNDLRDLRGGAVIVSHDRELLNQMDCILELSGGKIRSFGGNYDFYAAQKKAERQTIESQYANAEKRIARLSDTINIAAHTRAKHEAKQKKEIANARRSPISANALKGKSQETEAKARRIIQKKLDEQSELRQDLSTQLRDDKIKIPMPEKPFVRKELLRIENLRFGYDSDIFNGFDFKMRGSERVRIIGKNGSGKTTLIKLIMGELTPSSGVLELRGRAAYLNQDLSLLDPGKTIVENIMDMAGILKHDAHAIAANFGFRGLMSNKQVGVLSGGELLKATLAAVLGNSDQPDLVILDEPTNNLDIKSIAILEDALNQYGGAILLVSHDEAFVKNLHIDRAVDII
ncbi:MAG: ATP-binding cassette domain-containing protein [Rickettsiales bacterium]|jgi:ATPase subunit of ABC transporter with duplicated ATPase domains|nr:ATP-binding cassette domain-containing protein [Rickettsiales bacterium]